MQNTLARITLPQHGIMSLFLQKRHRQTSPVMIYLLSPKGKITTTLNIGAIWGDMWLVKISKLCICTPPETQKRSSVVSGGDTFLIYKRLSQEGVEWHVTLT